MEYQESRIPNHLSVNTQNWKPQSKFNFRCIFSVQEFSEEGQLFISDGAGNYQGPYLFEQVENDKLIMCTGFVLCNGAPTNQVFALSWELEYCCAKNIF